MRIAPDLKSREIVCSNSSTSASTIGFFDGFEDPEALTVLTGVSAGFHLSVIAVWSLAMTMAASAFGLHGIRLHVWSRPDGLPHPGGIDCRGW